jgi:hypothetical protein
MPSVWSEITTLPTGASSSAASRPVSPSPAASSSARSPGCGATASIIAWETSSAHRRICAWWRIQPAEASSQPARLLSR